jgi:hypothetical protein
MRIIKRKAKVRERPYASANKLAEYIDANALGRKKLLQLMKYPGQPPGHYYAEARDGIGAYLVSGNGVALQVLHKCLEEDDSGTEYERKLRASSIEGINAWWDRFDGKLPDFSGFILSAPPPFRRQPKLHLQGVDISVAPDVVAIGKERVGFIKLHFKKTYEMSADAGEFVATILNLYAKEYFKAEGEPSLKHCVVVDVMSSGADLEPGQLPIFTCPKGIVNKTKEIMATCEEIAARWSSIQPPPGWRP